MNNKKYLILQIMVVALMVIATAIQLILFSALSARMAAVEQKQDVMERHMDVLRDAQININH